MYILQVNHIARPNKLRHAFGTPDSCGSCPHSTLHSHQTSKESPSWSQAPPFPGQLERLARWDHPGIPWIKFKDLYGPLSHVSILGQSLVIIHHRDIANTILEKTSTKTSGRPQFIFGNEMCGYNQFLTVLPYNKTFKQQRKLVHQQLGTKTIASRFRDTQDVESHRLLLRIMESPEKLLTHIKT